MHHDWWHLYFGKIGVINTGENKAFRYQMRPVVLPFGLQNFAAESYYPEFAGLLDDLLFCLLLLLLHDSSLLEVGSFYLRLVNTSSRAF